MTHAKLMLPLLQLSLLSRIMGNSLLRPVKSCSIFLPAQVCMCDVCVASAVKSYSTILPAQVYVCDVFVASVWVHAVKSCSTILPAQVSVCDVCVFCA